MHVHKKPHRLLSLYNPKIQEHVNILNVCKKAQMLKGITKMWQNKDSSCFGCIVADILPCNKMGHEGILLQNKMSLLML